VWVMLLLAGSPLMAGCQSKAHTAALCFLGQGKVSRTASVVELCFLYGWDCVKLTA
jgi:hypothetical protein